MSLTGNIHDILKQIEFLIKIYGNATFTDIQKSIDTVKSASSAT